MDFVPENVTVVFKISDFENLKADLKNNSLLTKFQKTDPYLFFAENAALFENLHPTEPSLFCINQTNDSVAAYTFISKQSKNLFHTDSLKNKKIETLKLDDLSFQRITIDQRIAYSAIHDSVFVLSSSQQILLDILKGKTERNPTFKKVFSLPSSNEFTALVRGGAVAVTDSTNVRFTSWTSVDLALSPEAITATGITLATDTIPQLLNVFEGQVPQQNDAPSIIPTDALAAVSFTFNDAEKFQKNLREFRGEKQAVQTTGIFGSVSEAGTIDLKTETAIFIKSIDPQLTADALARYVSAKSEFREVAISAFSTPDLFQKTFSPFVDFQKANFVFQLDNFFLFTETEITAQQIISDFQTNNTLKNTSYYKETANDLSTASSLLIYKLQGNFSNALSRFFNRKSSNAIPSISFWEFPLAALQFRFDRNFAHVILSCRESGGSAKSISGTVTEKFNLKMDRAVLGNPQIFDGQNNGGNVVLQDMANTLYFISESGKILWTKNLGAPVLGTFESVTLSGHSHLTFATRDAFHILDRNGREAQGFPIKFKDAVTQPLAVFDYDNNLNYRFVVVQGKEVLMYDKAGKLVKGFNFSKAKSTIVQSPVHIRMGNKDYIVIAEENGKINILNRVGKPRITVSKNFNFSEIPIAEEDDTFVIITKEHTKERISQEGKVSSQKLEVGSSYWFAIHGNVKATLDDNLLRINGKLTELPLGLYSRPQIYTMHRNAYITLTETQEKKVYVFDRNGELLNGFPIYGTSAAGMGEGSAKNAKNIVVKGGPDSVILYTIN